MTEKELDLLEMMMEDMANRTLLAKIVGKENDIVRYLDRHIDELKKKILEL